MFFLVDKPPSISSFWVIQVLRRQHNIRKMGHIGTLDPLASGLMLIATGKSTKLIPLLEWWDKTYIFSVDISRSSPSHDLGTPDVSHDTGKFHIPRQSLLEKKILDQTHQIPPTYSAIHINGKRAYEYARSHVDIDIPRRPIRVKHVEILGWNMYTVSIRIRISSGWYIRSFAPLIGNWCGTDGGIVTSLRREAIHLPSGYDLTLNESQSMDLPIHETRHDLWLETLFPNATHIEINSERLNHYIHHGIPFPVPSDHEINPIHPIFAKLNDGTYSWLIYEEGVLKVKKNDIHESSQKIHI